MLIDFYSDEELYRLTGASRATIYRWRKTGTPKVVDTLLKTLDGFNFEFYHSTWSGWGINRKSGELFSPTNDCFKPWHIISLPYLHGALNGYKATERQARTEKNHSSILDFDKFKSAN